MTNILRIPANTQAYLTAIRDAAADKFDVMEFTYQYGNQASFPPAWAYWKMEEASGNRLDSSGNNRTLSLDSGYAVGYDLGILGNCSKFTANNQALIMSEEWDTRGDTKFTITCWMKMVANAGGTHRVLELTSNVVLWMKSDNMTKCYFEAGSESGGAVSWAIYDFNVWYFVCVYYDGTGLHLEVNNVEVASDAVVPTFDLVDEFSWGGTWVGYPHPSASPPTGYFDEVGIWLQALTAGQRAQLYNSGAGWSPY